MKKLLVISLLVAASQVAASQIADTTTQSQFYVSQQDSAIRFVRDSTAFRRGAGTIVQKTATDTVKLTHQIRFTKYSNDSGAVVGIYPTWGLTAFSGINPLVGLDVDVTIPNVLNGGNTTMLIRTARNHSKKFTVDLAGELWNSAGHVWDSGTQWLQSVAQGGGYINPGRSRTYGLYISDVVGGENNTPHALTVIHRTGPDTYSGVDDLSALNAIMDVDGTSSTQPATVTGIKGWVSLGVPLGGGYVPSAAIGIAGSVYNYGTGNMSNASGLVGNIQLLSSSGTPIITNARGLYVPTMTTSVGSITNAWGAYLEDQTVGTAENAALRFATTGKISWNNDVSLSRGGTGVLNLAGSLYSSTTGTSTQTPMSFFSPSITAGNMTLMMFGMTPFSSNSAYLGFTNSATPYMTLATFGYTRPLMIRGSNFSLDTLGNGTFSGNVNAANAVGYGFVANHLAKMVAVDSLGAAGLYVDAAADTIATRQYLRGEFAGYAPLASPTFTGTVSGITASMVGLGNVTNESKATMFSSPTFTGTAAAADLNLSGSLYSSTTGTSSQTPISFFSPNITAGNATLMMFGMTPFTSNSAWLGLVNSTTPYVTFTSYARARPLTIGGSNFLIDTTGFGTFYGLIAGVGGAYFGGGVTFAGSVSGLTKAMVGLGNVTNESKATMFTSPTFTGSVSGVSAAMVGLGNVTNESKTTMFTNPGFTGTVTGISASMVGLGNVANESKATMFTNPTFTGTSTTINSSLIGNGNWTIGNLGTSVFGKSLVGDIYVTDTTKLDGPVLFGNANVTGLTKAMVGLSNVANESKATMFSSPTFTGTVSGVTASMVGLGNVANESKATMFTDPTFTGTTTTVNSSTIGNSNWTIGNAGLAIFANSMTGTMQVSSTATLNGGVAMGSGSKVTQYDGTSTAGKGIAPIVSYATISDSKASSGWTNLAGTNTAGLYRVSVYYETHTFFGETDQVRYDIRWDAGQKVFTGTTILLASNRYAEFTKVVHHDAAGGAYIQYQSLYFASGSTDSYDAYVSVERIN